MHSPMKTTTCGYRNKTNGAPCGNPIALGSPNCAAGHPSEIYAIGYYKEPPLDANAASRESTVDFDMLMAESQPDPDYFLNEEKFAQIRPLWSEYTGVAYNSTNPTLREMGVDGIDAVENMESIVNLLHQFECFDATFGAPNIPLGATHDHAHVPPGLVGFDDEILDQPDCDDTNKPHSVLYLTLGDPWATGLKVVSPPMHLLRRPLRDGRPLRGEVTLESETGVTLDTPLHEAAILLGHYKAEMLNSARGMLTQ